MGTTTLKLPDALKERVASVVDGAGKSPHAFMVEAIEQQTRLAEQRKEFVAAALRGREQAMRSGKAYAFEDVKRYYTARLSGKAAKRPRLKRWRGS
jgi:predicted transcriptional regulator